MKDVVRTATNALSLLGEVVHQLIIVIGYSETWLRATLARAGFPADIQTVLIIIMVSLLIVTVIKLLSGFPRFIVVFTLLMIATHFVITTAGI